MVNHAESKRNGFTLVEVLMVVVIISVMAAITIPKISSSSDRARRNADIATAHQVKAALDRYQAENGIYPKPLTAEFTATSGTVTAANFIPKYVAKLDTATTQQKITDDKKGFGVETLTDGLIPASSTPTNLIMIYLSTDGSGAEVRAYDSKLAEQLWTSSN